MMSKHILTERWEVRPVPDMKTIVIARAGQMHPHAHVVTPTATPKALTPTEYARATLMGAAPDMAELLEKIITHEMGLSDDACDMIRATLAKAGIEEKFIETREAEKSPEEREAQSVGLGR
jgi:hypothetical protein